MGKWARGMYNNPMMDIERFSTLLDELAAALPQAVYHRLNLGIGVVARAKKEHRAQTAPVYILGEYRVHPVMGRGIVLYYGSFQVVYPHLEEPALRQEMDRVLKHELTHHLESLAGSRELEQEDARRLMRWQKEDTR